MEIDLSALDAVIAAGEGGPAGGAPIVLPLDLIDEDVHQPRTEFNADALQELAATIAERGVRQPISVRSHPSVPGRWMVNFGARRLRASRLVGRVDIPAFIDETADSYDQVIENEQREGLQPLELALFIERRMRAGESQAEVARRLGKSRMYVTYLCSLIDPPEWLLTLYRSGVCRGISELHELRRLASVDLEALMTWLSGREAISRTDLKTFKQGRAQVHGRTSGPPLPATVLPYPVTLRKATTPRVEVSTRTQIEGIPSTTVDPGPDAPPEIIKPEPTNQSLTRFIAKWGRSTVELVPDLISNDRGVFAVRVLDDVGVSDVVGLPCSDVNWVQGSELSLVCVAPVGSRRALP